MSNFTAKAKRSKFYETISVAGPANDAHITLLDILGSAIIVPVLVMNVVNLMRLFCTQ